MTDRFFATDTTEDDVQGFAPVSTMSSSDAIYVGTWLILSGNVDRGSRMLQAGWAAAAKGTDVGIVPRPA